MPKDTDAAIALPDGGGTPPSGVAPAVASPAAAALPTVSGVVAPQPDLAALLAALAKAAAAVQQGQTPAGAPAGPDSKHWLQSRTVLGLALTAATTVLPLVGPLVGLPITPTAAYYLSDTVWQAVQALGGAAGLGLAFQGRARATSPLGRSDVTLRL